MSLETLDAIGTVQQFNGGGSEGISNALGFILAVAGTVLGGVAAFIYNFFKNFKIDKRRENREIKVDDWTDTLLKRVGDLENKIDKFVEERNEAVAEAAELRTQLALANQKAEILEEEVKELRSIVEELKTARNETKKLLKNIQISYSALIEENDEFRSKLRLPKKVHPSLNSHTEATSVKWFDDK